MNKLKVKKRDWFTGWIGFSDGMAHFYNHNPGLTGNIFIADLFRSKRAAQKEYEDVRRVTLVFEDK